MQCIRYELVDGLNPANGFEKHNGRFTSSFGLQFLKRCWLLIWYWDQSFFVSPRQILQHHPSRSQWTVESNSFQIIYWFVSKGFKAFWTEPKNSDLRRLFSNSRKFFRSDWTFENFNGLYQNNSLEVELKIKYQSQINKITFFATNFFLF